MLSLNANTVHWKLKGKSFHFWSETTMIRIYCILNSMLLCLNFNVIMKYTCSCDYMEKIIEHMVDYRSVTLLFLPVLLLNACSSHKKAPAPCHHRHTNDRQTWIQDFNISSLAICRSLYSIFRAMFIKITQVFFIATGLWGRDSVGYYARSYYREGKVFKFKIYIPCKTKL